jgi:predicted NACHT family NTPase
MNAQPGRGEDPQLRPFSDFIDHASLVLLGDPGAGKTHLFKEAAAREHAVFLKARAFLSTPAARMANRVLFIDGLDEKRGGRGDRDTIDRMVEKLFEVNPPRVRISCRVADWLGESDLAAFGPYFQQYGTPPVLLLQNLSEGEQRAVLAAQGVSPGAADAFLKTAQEHGLDDFLENPQNLIMLWRVVQNGSWPSGRKELFELSTELLLQEADPDRARSGAGVYTASELRPVAGALCAIRLITDVDAVSLRNQEGTPETPGYRTVGFVDQDKAQAALGRRVFEAGAEPETVDYAHRTTAEYLAAAFLAQRVRDGLPVGRVLALIGVDHHPAPELRGLHAWLAVHLSEYADQLIEADPYGVLTYGDAASLSPSSCTSLIQALGKLSNSNPWFRLEQWQSRAVGALSRPDLISELRAVLADPHAGMGIRSIVIDALGMGVPRPELVPDLASILAREDVSYRERQRALLALLRLGDAGRGAVIDAFRHSLDSSISGFRLRTEIIQRLYREPFSASDVMAIMHEALEADGRSITGVFHPLADRIPLEEIPAILDGITLPQHRKIRYDRQQRWEVAAFYRWILTRMWGSEAVLDPVRAWQWLEKLRGLSEGNNNGYPKEMHAAMAAKPELLRAIADHFFETFDPEKDRWSAIMRFRETLFRSLPIATVLEVVLQKLDGVEDGNAKQLVLYEAAFSFCYATEQPFAGIAFEKLSAYADSRPVLADTRTRWITSSLDDWYRFGTFRKKAESEKGRAQQLKDFVVDAEAISTGAHLGWLIHLARIYFMLYGDVDRNLTPRQRLAAWLGETHVETALAGFRATLSRSDVPTFATVIAMTADHQQYDWWHALIAGMNERWVIGQRFDGLSDETLKALVAFDLVSPVTVVRDGSEQFYVAPWRQYLLDQRPELMRDVYLAVARARLSKNLTSHPEGLHELLTQPQFEPYRENVGIELLREFPNVGEFQLEQVLLALKKLPTARGPLRELIQHTLSGAVNLEERQRDLWLSAGYLLSPTQYEHTVEERAKSCPSLVFDLRDVSRTDLGSQPHEGLLNLNTLEFMACLTGRCYADTPHPEQSWGGDRNPWDASEHFRALANVISASSSEAATAALIRLEADPTLSSYRLHIRHVLANQRQRRRDAQYERPDWLKTVAALNDGAPATVADLHALTVQHFRDIRQQIERENTDIYKRFWNVDGLERLLTPRPEGSCRDYLIDLMRPRLLPKGITVEPEGHMVADKRADISVAMPKRKILCELKRDYHGEVWTAIEQQLDRFYTHDPEAKGFGIYCVFWFGAKRPNEIPFPPNGMSRPQSAGEMEQMLKTSLASREQNRIAVVVIDVSGTF